MAVPLALYHRRENGRTLSHRDRDKAAASPNYRITCKSSSIFLSPGFQLSAVLYSSSSDVLEAYSALLLLIIGIGAISGSPG